MQTVASSASSGKLYSPLRIASALAVSAKVPRSCRSWPELMGASVAPRYRRWIAVVAAFWKGSCPVIIILCPFSSVITHWDAGGDHFFLVAHPILPQVLRLSSRNMIRSSCVIAVSLSSCRAMLRRCVMCLRRLGNATGRNSFSLSLHLLIPS